MRKTLGDFKTVGITVDIVPVVRNIDEMDLHLRARIGKKSYMRSIEVKMCDEFEVDMTAVLKEASSCVVELIKKESPELFLTRGQINGIDKEIGPCGEQEHSSQLQPKTH